MIVPDDVDDECTCSMRPGASTLCWTCQSIEDHYSDPDELEEPDSTAEHYVQLVPSYPYRVSEKVSL